MAEFLVAFAVGFILAMVAIAVLRFLASIPSMILDLIEAIQYVKITQNRGR